MHNYHATNGSLPKPAITGKDGKPLLSWRVAILPFIEQQPLYNKFKLDEPWDSPNNKALIKEMPPVYICPETGRRRAVHHDLSGVHRPGGVVRKRQGDGVPGGHRRDVEHDHGRRGQGGGSLDQARRRARSSTRRRSLHSTEQARHTPAASTSRSPMARYDFIPDSINVNLFHDLVTRNGGEHIDFAQFPEMPRPGRPGRPREVPCTSIQTWSPRPTS